MGEIRKSEWLDSSLAFVGIEMLLLCEIQALGELDVELIEDSAKIKINSQTEEDQQIKRRHFLISKLWILGAYEVVRFLNDLDKQRGLLVNDLTKSELRDVLTTFTKVRVPLAKFQKAGNNKKLYESIADSFIDQNNGVGWKVYSLGKNDLRKEIFLRKDLGDRLLKLLKNIKKDLTKN